MRVCGLWEPRIKRGGEWVEPCKAKQPFVTAGCWALRSLHKSFLVIVSRVASYAPTPSSLPMKLFFFSSTFSGFCVTGVWGTAGIK